MRTSKLLTLDTAQHGDAKVLAGPDADGWYHVQVGAGARAGTVLGSCCEASIGQTLAVSTSTTA